MLQHLLIHVEDREESNNGQEAIYKIKCWQLLASYIGKTGRNHNPRLTEYKLAMRNGDANTWQTTTLTDWTLPNLQYKVFSMTDSGKLVH